MKIVTGHRSLARDEVSDGTCIQIQPSARGFIYTTNKMEGRISSSARMTGGFLFIHNNFSIVIHSPKPLKSTIHLTVLV